MCDGCTGDVMVASSRDRSKWKPLHQSTKTGRLFLFASVPTFGIQYVSLERTTKI